MAYKVNVLMSTYNGERYIEEQIDSIMGQKGVDVKLYVRDDGSHDQTQDIIKELMKKYDHRIILYSGDNKGYKKSFTELMLSVPLDADYYSFSDQDDVWKSDKLQRACEYLSHQKEPALYCAKPQYVDDHLHPIEGNGGMLDSLPLGEAGTNEVLATGLYGLGCTMAWNKQLQEIVHTVKDLEKYDFAHDNFMTLLAGMVGKVYLDSYKVFLYRQHGNNASGDKATSISRKERLAALKEASLKIAVMREAIYDHYGQFMTNENKKLLETSISYKKNIIKKFVFMIKGYPKKLNRYQRMKFITLVLGGLF